MNRVNQVELSAGYCEGRGRQTGCVSDGRHLRDAGAAPFLLPFSLFRRDATSTITSFNRFCRSSSDGSARNERCVSTEFRDFRKVEESFYPKLSPPLPPLSSRPSNLGDVTSSARSSALLLQSSRISLVLFSGRWASSVLHPGGAGKLPDFCRYSRMKTDGARFHGVCRHGWEETDTAETVLKVLRKKEEVERTSVTR